MNKTSMPLLATSHVIPIAMWDFSWLERRWPGAGYEDWGQALDALLERGYEAVRIDAYPHLVSKDFSREWELPPCWNTVDWGAPARTRVRPGPALIEFLAACAKRGIKAGLSTWFRRDADNMRMHITGPAKHAAAWLDVLNRIHAEGMIDTLLYVDLCNEWTSAAWAPVFHNPPPYQRNEWDSPPSMAWLNGALKLVREQYPLVPLTVSTNARPWRHGETDVSAFDFLEPHLWMASANTDEFNRRIGYAYEPFDPKGFDNLAAHGEKLYRADSRYWLGVLSDIIECTARAAGIAKRPLMTTEGWSIVDYKDWPLLDWGWVKEGCAHGVETALATGRWCCMCTSNFCGPQFRGMWRDIGWHQRLTSRMKSTRFRAC
ncbi:MAG: cellulase [Opitutaceae bacterium]|jgi:hypothetical protein|nr:cellulase [Opitutaceae bacterium]